MKTYAWLPLVAFCIAGCSKEEAYKKPITPVRIQAVETQGSTDGPKYSGSIEPASRVDLAFRLGGYVSSIMSIGGRPLHEGDIVAKGTPLVHLRADDYSVKVAQAQSQLNQAKAGMTQVQVGVTKAKQDYDRADTLYKKQSLTRSDMDGAKAQLDNFNAQVPLAQARIDGAQAQVNEANLALRDSTLTAPLHAVVIKRLVEVGTLVGPGTPAFVLADLNSLKAVFGAPDVLLSQLHIGMSLSLTTEALPGAFTGHITAIASAADPRSRVFDVEVTFPNPGLRLKPGMIVTIKLPTTVAAVKVPVVPMASIVRSKSNPNGYAVYIVEDNSGKPVAHLRDVTLGTALNNAVIVSSGLRAGEKVIISGATLVSDGETVQIVP